jgi:hypothetical protein
MKITLDIDDMVMDQLKREAARQGRTISRRSRPRSSQCFCRNASKDHCRRCRYSIAAAPSSTYPIAPRFTM